MNILIVEDEILIANSIKRILSEISFVNNISISTNFEDGFDKINTNVFDIFLIDINLGNNQFTGIDLGKIIRKNNPCVPIIYITVHSSISYLEKAFGLGANDYITKPFRSQELLLRVKRWVSSVYNLEKKDIIVYNSMKYDFNRNEFYWNSKKIELTKNNKKLLLIFLLNSEKILSNSFLREKLWGDHDMMEKNRNLRSNIQNLRIALNDICKDWIITIRGEGYMLIKKSKRNYEKNSTTGGGRDYRKNIQKKSHKRLIGSNMDKKCRTVHLSSG